ncbi:MAG: hypothetical protein FJ096_13805 [Deltaproteobacteria bacterium]|nr:hypothetical protein [Deltaproteobacteria bacterium]
MLLFQKRFHEGLVAGKVTLTFRRWPRCRVKPGGRYRCHPIGVLEVDRVERIPVRSIDEHDARRAGFDSLPELLAYLASGPSGAVDAGCEVYRIELHHAGDGDRVAAALDATLDEAARRTLDEALRKLDRDAPWTHATLELIRTMPRIAASQLAARQDRETASFKADVCKLKRLGLTQSFEVGYEVSPRGEAYLASSSQPSRRTAKRRMPE